MSDPNTTRSAALDPWEAFRDVVTEGWLLQKQLAHRRGLSMAQYMLLRDIARRGSARPSELAEEFGVSPPAMTILIGGLESRGWVRRTRTGNDRRAVRVVLTGKARRVLDAVESRRARTMRSAIAPVPSERRKELARTLEVIGTRLRAERVRAQGRASVREDS